MLVTGAGHFFLSSKTCARSLLPVIVLVTRVESAPTSSTMVSHVGLHLATAQFSTMDTQYTCDKA